MRQELVELLRCPVDLGQLSLTENETGEDGHVIEGELSCILCDQRYSIAGGVPHLLPGQELQIDGKNLTRLQNQTIDRFGFEWRHFQDWGWLTEYPAVPEAELKFFGGLMEHSTKAFWSKTLFDREVLKPGHLVLDAGCGNGRFTYQAAQTGAQVIGIDLGWGVLSAFEHTRSMPHVHIIRGDLFQLPFANQTFSRIFSIGVLQHTGNAGAAFDSLARVLQERGLLAVHVYGQGLRSYEWLDAGLRHITTRLPISGQLAIARSMAAVALWLRRRNEKLYWQMYQHVNLLPTKHHMFDWWAAPIATHHSPPEVLQWFRRNGLEVLRTNPPATPAAEEARMRNHGAITAMGHRAAVKV